MLNQGPHSKFLGGGGGGRKEALEFPFSIFLFYEVWKGI